MLNQDVIFHMSSFLTLPEYLRASLAWRELRDLIMLRRVRMKWCVQRVVPPTMKPGTCSNAECTRQKLYCIYLEPLKRNVLSLYCGPCTVKFKNINLVILL